MKTVLSIAALAYALACTPKTTTRSAPAAAPEASEHVVAEGQYRQAVQLAVGQKLRIAVPAGIPEWQVGYDNALLEMLTPAAKVRSPGPDGWVFRARAAGSGEIVMTSIARPGGAPNVLRVSVQFKIS